MKKSLVLIAALLAAPLAYAQAPCYSFTAGGWTQVPCPGTTVTPTPVPTQVPTPVPTPAPVTKAAFAVPMGELDDTLTTPSLYVRAAPGLPAPADKTLIHEIAPCRLVDTRIAPGTAFVHN